MSVLLEVLTRNIRVGIARGQAKARRDTADIEFTYEVPPDARKAQPRYQPPEGTVVIPMVESAPGVFEAPARQ